MPFEIAKSMVGEATLKQGLKYIRNNPEKNLVNLAKWRRDLSQFISMPGNGQKCFLTRITGGIWRSKH